MNMILTALNAAALIALITFHFHDSGTASETVTQTAQTPQMVRQIPQLAIMTDKRANAAMLTNDAEETLQIPRSEQRWVF